MHSDTSCRRSQIEKERFSSSFGLNLLPGMYFMPVHAVPDPGAKKFRFVTNHSAGQHALNNMISLEDVSGPCGCRTACSL